MSLKIDEIRTDHADGTQMSGLFDGEPFRLFVDGGKWLFRTAKGWTHIEDAHSADSLAEARNFAYSAVANFRMQNRMA